MFVDASALAAMMLDEDKARVLAARLQGAGKRLTSPVSAVEASAAVSLALGLGPVQAEAAVQRFLAAMGIQQVSLPVQVTGLAADALARFGQASGHPAMLTVTEALAYAAARYYRLPLLYEGHRFAATDIEAG